ncbi:hypothetical protein [Brucella gallinifaecis]|uniref:hypothetical protein n=1 Tax=Brucella gallinifaecis TaxID=215590 RepID=UPI00236039DA|nr:hypothetical protein [Brucella gallinifaecis]
MYAKFNQAGLARLSEDQLSKHKASRERAIIYVSELLDDIPLSEVSHADVLRYGQWWTDKIASEKLKAYGTNGSFSDMKRMLPAIDDALQTNFRAPWSGVRLKEFSAIKLAKRLPFPVKGAKHRLMLPARWTILIKMHHQMPGLNT